METGGIRPTRPDDNGTARRRLRPAAAWLAVAAAIAAVPGCRSGLSRGDILFADGLDRLALGDTLQAIEFLQEAAYHAPQQARAHFHVGRLLAQSDRIEDRARAERALRRAVELDPGSGLYAEALGALQRRQGFHNESTRTLRRAVAIDPRLPQAWFLLGLNLQADYREDPSSTELRDSTLACFERTHACDAAHDEARYRLAYLCMVRREFARARALVEPLVRAPSCPSRFAWLWAAIEYRAGGVDAAGDIVDAALGRVAAAERLEVLGLEPLLHPDSALDYRACAESQRLAMVRDYWWRHDPTPATLLNERLVEHVARRVEADFDFEVPRLGLAGHSTDRGEIYLRYGPPLERHRIADAEAPAWEWVYADSSGETWSFVFMDAFRNGNYLRRRRGARSDFAHLERLEAEPARTSIAFRAPPGGWRHAVRRFRAAGRGVALEIAYAIGPDSLLEGIQLLATGWRAPGVAAANRHGEVRCRDLHRRADGWHIGRLRFEVPPEPLELGLQILGRRQAASDTSAPADHRAWVAFGRDTLSLEPFDDERIGLSDLMLAHALEDGVGGLFDMGGVQAVPRVDGSISDGVLHAYFEIYPTEEILRAARPLAVTYRVQTAPPRRWRFRDQFRWSVRRRQALRPAVETTFVVQPRSEIERQRLSIDVTNLAPGDYTFSVEVQDTAGDDVVLREADFDILVPAPRR